MKSAPAPEGHSRAKEDSLQSPSREDEKFIPERPWEVDWSHIVIFLDNTG